MKPEFIMSDKEQKTPARSFPDQKGNYTYIVKCRDGSLYTGWTTDLEKRIRVHNSGKGAKYTRSRGPVELVYYEKFETKALAMRREYEIKQLNHKEKERLLEREQRKDVSA